MRRRLFFGVLLWTTLASAMSIAGAEQTGPQRQVLAADDSRRTIALLDGNGKVLWRHAVGPIHDAQLLDNGHVLFQTNFQNIVEIDRGGKTVWQYSAKSNGNEKRPVEVHAFQRLPNGLTMIAESGPARIIEVDREGKIQHQVALKVDHPNAHRDTRLVRKLDSGNYLVAHEGDGMVREYDPAGKVVWEFPVPLFGKPRKGGHGVESFGNEVFSAVRLANGNTLIGTGNGHSVLEVTPAKEIVWKLEQGDLPGIQLAWVTTLQPLANGNIIVGNCHAGKNNPQLIEVTRDKKVVWTFYDFELFGDSTPVAIVLDESGMLLK